jgi:hypothetical protein
VVGSGLDADAVSMPSDLSRSQLTLPAIGKCLGLPHFPHPLPLPSFPNQPVPRQSLHCRSQTDPLSRKDRDSHRRNRPLCQSRPWLTHNLEAGWAVQSERMKRSRWCPSALVFDPWSASLRRCRRGIRQGQGERRGSSCYRSGRLSGKATNKARIARWCGCRSVLTIPLVSRGAHK